MDKDYRHLARFRRTLALTILVFIGFVATFVLYVYAEKRIDRANEVRQRSFQLAEELRQSSDDMTRMVRTYVETGNPIYKQHFQEILDIRNGLRPLPIDSHNIYWDLVLTDDKRPRPFGPAAALLERMRAVGFSLEEFTAIEQAKIHSDQLAEREFAVMQLAEGEPKQRDAAKSMLHDESYHSAKAQIMAPIAKFYELMDRRTSLAVLEAERTALLMRMAFVLFILILIFTLFRSYRAMEQTLGGSVDALHGHIARLGSGDLDAPIPVPERARDSILGWLSEMRDRLRDAESRRQEAERALQASIERLKDAQRTAHIGSWYLDLINGKLEWSDEIFRLFEIDPVQFEATYEGFLNVIHPDDRDMVNKAYSDSLVNRTPYEITHRLLMKDGRIKWVHERCSTEFDVQGKPLSSQGTVQDVTSRILSDEQLRIAAAAFEAQEGMMVTDAQSVILRVNKAFTEITGYSPEEVIGKTPRILQSGRHDATFYRQMWEAVTATGAWQGEVWDRHKSGKIYPKWLTISAVKNGDGRITHYIGVHYDITERKKAEERIRSLAFYDQLTDLPNRVLLLERLNRAMVSGVRNGHYGALLFIDLDNFKVLNDTQGHEIGDILLRQVADRLRNCVREEDTAARLGGDEFVVVIAGLGAVEQDGAATAEAIGEKILAELRRPFQIGAISHQGGASIGITLFRGQLATTDELMKQADLAMYKAKASGRNAVRFFDPELESAIKARAEMEIELRHAIENDELAYHYQPQIDDRQGVVGAEVLVRWQHPRRGIISPAEFIPLAEDTGLILPLGHKVLEAACTTLAAWANEPRLKSVCIAVNVSPRQFRQGDFVERVLDVISRSGADPSRLKLELTEGMLVENIDEVIQKMVDLKAKGIGFALDDFGTGYSSLAYLKRLPLDQLKIDRSFVSDVLVDTNDAVIARTIVALAQSLGIAVVAEGVETEGQRHFLRTTGCSLYQGYLFSRPIPVGDFERLVNS